MVEAAGNALLQAPLDPYDPSPDGAVVKRLRSATFLQRRAWRPIGETWRRVDSLERPLRLTADDQVLTVADTLGVDDQRDVDLDGWQDHRVPRVLTQLSEDERDVAMAYAPTRPPLGPPLALQRGAPLASLAGEWQQTWFVPNGTTDDPEIPHTTSLADYLARRLTLDHHPAAPSVATARTRSGHADRR